MRKDDEEDEQLRGIKGKIHTPFLKVLRIRIERNDVISTVFRRDEEFWTLKLYICCYTALQIR